MKCQRWKHMVVEGRGGEGGRGLCEKWWRVVDYLQGGRVKKPLLGVKKRVKTHFST